MAARDRCFSLMIVAWLAVAAATAGAAEPGLRLDGKITQGGLVIGHAAPGAIVSLDGRPVRVADDGVFMIGFGRDAKEHAELAIDWPDGRHEVRRIEVAQRQWQIQRIDGLPESMVTPPEAVVARILHDAKQVKEARAIDTEAPWFRAPMRWPAKGVISGVYGSQRILNGKPRQPHFGVDIAAPVGTPVVAPKDGVVRLAADLYFTGNTLILDHGYGLTTTYSHLSEIAVSEGDKVSRGQQIGAIGATGRATGPHLDWRVNLFDTRLDPALLLEAPPN